jgi:uncharacterized Zn-binding protein involved in type VI secretion
VKRGLISAADVALCNKDGASGLSNGTGDQVFVNGAVSVRLGDPGTYPTSCASAASPFHALEGSANVNIQGQPAVGSRHTAAHAHSVGVYGPGSANVFIGMPSVNIFRRARADGLALIDQSIASLERWNDVDQAHFKLWFGNASREQVLTNFRATRAMLADAEIRAGEDDLYGHYSGGNTLYMDNAFWRAPPGGKDGQAGIMVHEAAHGGPGADDYRYGHNECKALARDDYAQAIWNADNYEFFAEGAPP